MHAAAAVASQQSSAAIEPQLAGGLSIDAAQQGAIHQASFGGRRIFHWGNHHNAAGVVIDAELKPNAADGSFGGGLQLAVRLRPQQAGVGIIQGRQHGVDRVVGIHAIADRFL